MERTPTLTRLGLRRGVIAAGLVVAALLVGCGADEDDGGFSPIVSEPMSKVEFLREADRICVGVEAQIEAAADELVLGSRRPDPREVERVALDVVVPALETEVAAIGALSPPPGDEARVEAILTATERGIAEVEANPRALIDGIPAPLRRAQQLAQAYGSSECGLR